MHLWSERVKLSFLFHLILRAHAVGNVRRISMTAPLHVCPHRAVLLNNRSQSSVYECALLKSDTRKQLKLRNWHVEWRLVLSHPAPVLWLVNSGKVTRGGSRQGRHPNGVRPLAGPIYCPIASGLLVPKGLVAILLKIRPIRLPAKRDTPAR